MHSPESTTEGLQQNDCSASVVLPDETATAALAVHFAPCLRSGMVVYFDGDLGAGKTCFVRAMLRALGHTGPVKSPTYALVEIYVVSSIYWYHFDFYRFSYPEEFINAGLDEYFRKDSICLVEWPAKAAGFVPSADIVVSLGIEGINDVRRRATITAMSPEGEQCLTSFRIARAAASSASLGAPP